MAELMSVYDIPQSSSWTRKVRFELDHLPFLNFCPIQLFHHALAVWGLTSAAAPALTLTPSQQPLPQALVYFKINGLFKEEQADRAVSIKADNAAVPVHLWNDRLWAGCRCFSPPTDIWLLPLGGHQNASPAFCNAVLSKK
jgi:hypothetical protein